MQKQAVQVALNYGAYYGLSVFSLFLLIFYLGGNPFGPASMIGALILIFWVCMVQKNYRDKYSNGYMNYGEAMGISMFTLFAGASLYGVLVYIFGTIIHPQMLQDYKDYALQNLEQVKDLKLFESMMDKAAEAIEKTTLPTLAFGDFFYKILGGFFTSLICAAIFKKVKQIDFKVEDDTTKSDN